MPLLRQLHSALQEFATKNHFSLETLHSLGYLSLTVERKHHIRIIPLPGGNLVITSRLCRMPKTRSEQEKIIDQLLGLSYVHAKKAEVFPALTPEHDSFNLQILIPSDIKLWIFEKKLAHFLHHLGLWRDYLNKKS